MIRTLPHLNRDVHRSIFRVAIQREWAPMRRLNTFARRVEKVAKRFRPFLISNRRPSRDIIRRNRDDIPMIWPIECKR